MRIISKITDFEVLGTEGLSQAAPRYTARAILKRADGCYAVMYADKFHLYSLPGGGIENGETPEEAVRREIWEETGCVCDTIKALGIVYENRFHANYTQYSYYYFMRTDGAVSNLQLTKSEMENRTSVQWHSLDTVISLISEPAHPTNQQRFLQARDVAALTYFLNHGGKSI